MIIAIVILAIAFAVSLALHVYTLDKVVTLFRRLENANNRITTLHEHVVGLRETAQQVES